MIPRIPDGPSTAAGLPLSSSGLTLACGGRLPRDTRNPISGKILEAVATFPLAANVPTPGGAFRYNVGSTRPILRDFTLPKTAVPVTLVLDRCGHLAAAMTVYPPVRSSSAPGGNSTAEGPLFPWGRISRPEGFNRCENCPASRLARSPHR